MYISVLRQGINPLFIALSLLYVDLSNNSFNFISLKEIHKNFWLLKNLFANCIHFMVGYYLRKV